ncbi:MAG: cell division protein FtsQ/DivIB [Minisyncoccota bacterium]
MRSSEHNKEKRKKYLIKLSIFFFVLLFVFGLSIYLSRLKSIQIDTVSVSGATIISPEILEGEVKGLITDKYFWLFPKTNVFIYPQKNIEQSLLKKFPRIQSISSSILDNHIISVNVTEREPFALWCDTVPTSSTVSQCYFLDKNGFVFDHAPQFSGNAYFKYYGFLPYEAPVGSYYISSTTRFHELSDFVESVKKLDITPLYIIAKDQDDFELFIFGGGKILINTQESFAKLSERLSALLKTQNLVPRKGGELLVEYIDLRFGNKMFYKPKTP